MVTWVLGAEQRRACHSVYPDVLDIGRGHYVSPCWQSPGTFVWSYGVAEHVAYSGLDFTPPAQERTLKADTPIVVVLHGLTGGPG